MGYLERTGIAEVQEIEFRPRLTDAQFIDKC